MAKKKETPRINITELYPKAELLYKSFCDENNVEFKLPHPTPADEDEMNTNAYKMIKEIKKIENKGVIPNPLDTNQWKHWPYFVPNSSGSGLSCYGYGDWRTYARVPARLCSLDSDNVEPCANKYQLIYDILES